MFDNILITHILHLNESGPQTARQELENLLAPFWGRNTLYIPNNESPRMEQQRNPRWKTTIRRDMTTLDVDLARSLGSDAAVVALNEPNVRSVQPL